MNTNAPATAFVARLYFGRFCPDGSQVGPAAFAAFLDAYVAPVLAGWTTTDAEGGWLDATTGSRVVEPSTVVETFVTGTDAERATTIEALRQIARAYAERFGQDAVGLTIVPAAVVEFIGAARA